MGILADWQIEKEVKITPFERYDRRKQAGKISWGLGSYGYDVRVGHVFDIFTQYPGHPVDPKNFDRNNLRRVDLTPGHHWEIDPADAKNNGHVCHHCGNRTTNPKTTGHTCRDRADHILIPPNSFALGESVEHFEIPRDILVVAVGKSTYARCGIIVNVTPGEPEWKGKWTIEISNTTPLPAKIYAGEGIMQCLFLRSDGVLDAGIRTLDRMLNQHFRLEEQESRAVLGRAFRELMDRRTCRVSYADKKGKYQDQGGLTLPSVVRLPTDEAAILAEAAAGARHKQRLATDAEQDGSGGVWDYGADVPPEGRRYDDPPPGPSQPPAEDKTPAPLPDTEELVLENDDLEVPDEVLARIKTRVRSQSQVPPPPPQAPQITPLYSNSVTSIDVGRTAAEVGAGAMAEPDPNLPPDDPPAEYLDGRKLWSGPDGAGWRYNRNGRTWVQVTDPPKR